MHVFPGDSFYRLRRYEFSHTRAREHARTADILTRHYYHERATLCGRSSCEGKTMIVSVFQNYLWLCRHHGDGKILIPPELSRGDERTSNAARVIPFQDVLQCFFKSLSPISLYCSTTDFQSNSIGTYCL